MAKEIGGLTYYPVGIQTDAFEDKGTLTFAGFKEPIPEGSVPKRENVVDVQSVTVEGQEFRDLIEEVKSESVYERIYAHMGSHPALQGAKDV